MEAIHINKFFTGESNGELPLWNKFPAVRRFPFRERCTAGEVFRVYLYKAYLTGKKSLFEYSI
jgi:hypothetical protein